MAFFIPRNNAWFSLCVSVSPFTRHLLTLGIVLSIVGGWYGCVYRITEKRINSYGAHITTPKQQQAQLNAEKKKQARLDEELHVAQQALERLADDGADQVTEQMAAIIKQTHTSGIAFNACTFCAEDDQGWCTKQSTSCSFTGNLYQLLHFFDALRSSDTRVQCTKLSMNTSADNQFTIQCGLDFWAIKSPST